MFGGGRIGRMRWGGTPIGGIPGGGPMGGGRNGLYPGGGPAGGGKVAPGGALISRPGIRKGSIFFVSNA